MVLYIKQWENEEIMIFLCLNHSINSPNGGSDKFAVIKFRFIIVPKSLFENAYQCKQKTDMK